MASPGARLYWALFALLSLITTCLADAAVANSTNPDATDAQTSKNTYDYIVVGSGPGGGPLASNLARAGYSVLLIEAGDDQSADLATVIPTLAILAPSEDTLRWQFFVRHYADLNKQLKHHLLTWRLTDGSLWVGQNPPAGATLLGVYYPRGATLGGSAIINNLVAFLPPNSDWQNIVDLTGDQAWSPSNMRNILKRLENNHAVPQGTPGHGFSGFLDIINAVGDASQYRNETSVVAILKAMIVQLGLNPAKFYDYLYDDINSADPSRDSTPGFFGVDYTSTPSWHRVTSRDLILATVNAKKPDGSQKYPLTLKLNTLASKVLFSSDKAKPRAIGVQYLSGKSVYGAVPRSSSGNRGTPGTAYARKEVIVSGGTFNSPQLLKLSGVGPKAELQKFNIPVVADVPGVGRNLMDNPEIPVVGQAKIDFVSSDNSSLSCTFGAPGDPCVAQWQQGTGPYTKGGINANSLIRRTPYAVNTDRDMFMFSGPFVFRGYLPPTNQSLFDPPNTFGMSTVKMHNQNRAGTVLLRSADPRDTPEINFNYFTDGANIDIPAIMDTIKFGRRAYINTPAPVGPVNVTEPPCASAVKPDGSCNDATDREWVEDQSFGHHPTSSCAIGADSDPLAVLDSKFRVRGVKGLRVVDASAHPRSPGAFPQLPTYMLSIQAGDFILADAASWT